MVEDPYNHVSDGLPGGHIMGQQRMPYAVDHHLAQQAEQHVVQAINSLAGCRNLTGSVSKPTSSSSAPFSSSPLGFSFPLSGIASPTLPLWMFQQPALNLCCQQLVSTWLSSLTSPKNPQPSVPHAPMHLSDLTHSSAPPPPAVANYVGLEAPMRDNSMPLPHTALPLPNSQSPLAESPVRAFAELLCADGTGVVLQSVITVVEDSWKAGVGGNWDPCAAVLRGVSCLLDSCEGAAVRLEEWGLSKRVSSLTEPQCACLWADSVVTQQCACGPTVCFWLE